MKKIFIIIISLIYLCPNQGFSQKNKNKTANQVLTGIAGLGVMALMNSEYKEKLELKAANYLMLNYPNYTQFRLKAMGWGAVKKFSDAGDVYMVPFSISKLNKGEVTNDRSVLFLYISTNHITQFGVDFSKVKWELWDKNKWNQLMIRFTELAFNGEDVLKIENGEIPVYETTSDGSVNAYAVFATGDPIKYISIEKAEFSGKGWKTENGSQDLWCPFYDLKGDDYVVGDYSDYQRIFFNEKTLGLFDKNIVESVLIPVPLINKIHEFINLLDVK